MEIPKKRLVVLTGVSGSGKSSLAFDTLYAEGQRRYIESVGALIVVDGYQGLGPLAPPVQWLYTPEAANIAAMQQILERYCHAHDFGDRAMRLWIRTAFPDLTERLELGALRAELSAAGEGPR